MPALPIDTDQIVITASRAPETGSANAGQRHHHRPAADRAARRAARHCAASTDAFGSGHEHRARRLAHRGPHSRRRGQSYLAVRRRNQDQRSGLRRYAALRASERRPRLADRGRPGAAIRVVGLGRDRRRHRGQWPRRCAWLCRRRRGRIVRVSPSQCVRQRSRRAMPACQARSAGSAPPASTALERPAATRTATETSRAECAGRLHLGSDVRLGASAIAFTGRTQFDGYDPITFEHTDTLDNTRNRLAAGRIWAEFGGTETRVERTGRRLAARLVEPQLPRERCRSTGRADAAHDRCAARTSLRDRRRSITS